LRLEKDPGNDSFVIAGGSVQERSYSWGVEQKRRHNRGIQTNRKGFRPSIRTSVYKIQPKDLVWVGGEKYSVVGVQNRGKYVKVEGVSRVIAVSQVDRVYNFGSIVWG
jgi:hypothetical protein